MKTRPKRHVDIGSEHYFSVHCSAMTEAYEFYDVRPVYIPLPGLTCGTADLVALPFPDGSVESLSCLHVMEHVGLGRYGDKVDARGDLSCRRRAFPRRGPGGQFLFAIPMNQQPKVQFNAHRMYSYDICPVHVLGAETEGVHAGHGQQHPLQRHAGHWS